MIEENAGQPCALLRPDARDDDDDANNLHMVKNGREIVGLESKQMLMKG